jgi:hypothetical protein
MFLERRLDALPVLSRKLQGGLLALHVRQAGGQGCPSPLRVLVGGAEGGFGLSYGSFKRARVDLIQQLAGLYVGTLLEIAFQQESAGLRPDLGNAHRRNPAGQLHRQGYRFGLDGQDRHLTWGNC